jgi:hypothetical protein
MIQPVSTQAQSGLKESLEEMFKSPVSDAQVHSFLSNISTQLNSIIQEGDAAAERMKKEAQEALDLAIS